MSSNDFDLDLGDEQYEDLAGDDFADEAPVPKSRRARLSAYADSFADDVLDELLPESFDWRGMVRSYPLTATAVAVVGGFLLARQHGTTLLATLGSLAAREVSRNVGSLFGGEDA